MKKIFYIHSIQFSIAYNPQLILTKMTSLISDYNVVFVLTLIRNGLVVRHFFGNHECSIFHSSDNSDVFFRAEPIFNGFEQFIPITSEEEAILTLKLNAVHDWFIFVDNIPPDGAMGGAPGPLPTFEELDLIGQAREIALMEEANFAQIQQE